MNHLNTIKQSPPHIKKLIDQEKFCLESYIYEKYTTAKSKNKEKGQQKKVVVFKKTKNKY